MDLLIYVCLNSFYDPYDIYFIWYTHIYIYIHIYMCICVYNLLKNAISLEFVSPWMT